MTDASYDSVPYSPLIHGCTHPQIIASVASLYGLAVPLLDGCRVLDLGCAVGTNLIAMAQVMPSSEFIGIDYVATQIDTARQTVKEVGLDNVRFIAADFRDCNDLGEFDFIIAHGLYSWVSDELRSAILALCKRHLSRQGIAYISYNTLPGCFQRQAVRDLMQFHFDGQGDARQMVEQGRKIVEEMAKATQKMSAPSSKILHQECMQAAGLDPAYLLHDFLEANNQPVYFHQFVTAVKTHGLAYITDAVMFSRRPEDMGVDSSRFSITDVVGREQYYDFLANVPFRRSLVCHADVAVEQEPLADRLLDKYLVLTAKRDRSIATVEYNNGAGMTLKVQNPLLIQLLERLDAAVPAALAVADILDAIDVAVRPDVLGWLLQAVSNGYLAMQGQFVGFVSTVSDKPEISALARYQSRIGDNVANLQHENAKIHGVIKAMMPYIDGSRTIEQLQLVLQDLHNTNACNLDVQINCSSDLNDRLRDALAWLAREAFLVS